MPGASDVQYGNEKFDLVLNFNNVTFPTLAANASSTNTLSVPGCLPLDVCTMTMIAPPAHLFLDNCYVSAAGVLTITWSTDGTGVTGASNLQLIGTITRATNANLGTSVLPSAIV